MKKRGWSRKLWLISWSRLKWKIWKVRGKRSLWRNRIWISRNGLRLWRNWDWTRWSRSFRRGKKEKRRGFNWSWGNESLRSWRKLIGRRGSLWLRKLGRIRSLVNGRLWRRRGPRSWVREVARITLREPPLKRVSEISPPFQLREPPLNWVSQISLQSLLSKTSLQSQLSKIGPPSQIRWANKNDSDKLTKKLWVVSQPSTHNRRKRSKLQSKMTTLTI